MTTYRDLAPRVDIIIPGWGREELTIACLKSILASRTAIPYRILYVDNGSPRFYKLLSTFVDEPALTVVRLPFNHGFCRGTNVGLSLSALNGTEFALLLNNDTEIPGDAGDWLERLLDPFKDPQVGAVGAVSDRVFGHQRRDSPGAGVTETDVLVGFAMAIRGAALRQVGLIDERFEPGNYEDFDYSLRLRRAGYRLVIAESVWISHAMHASMSHELDTLLRVNREKFERKWNGLAVRLGSPAPAAAPAEPVVRLITHATADWRPMLQPYLKSLASFWPWSVEALIVGEHSTLGPGERLVPRAAGAAETTASLQHGAFLEHIPGHSDDVLVYTDGCDMLLQRAPSTDEQALLRDLPEGVVLAGYNSGPYETLALEASRLGPRVPDLAEYFDGQLLAEGHCYNMGVIAARRQTWSAIHARYMELWPTACRALARPQRQQWLVCYVIAELGLRVDVLPYTFHMHGCYALPAGGAVDSQGLATYQGQVVLFRHHLEP